MLTIVLQPLVWRSEQRIAILFERHTHLNKLLRMEKSVRWSHTHACWHTAQTKDAYERLKTLLQTVVPPPPIDASALRSHLQQEKSLNKERALLSPVVQSITRSETSTYISEGNSKQLLLFTQQLVLKAYSPSTIRTYRNEMVQLLKVLNNTNVEDLTP
ncbi:MAG: hypothetical protein EOP48_01995 [Sphingobacteriales bacterium]|nr:MAG: hypothetical protein EOP48_01995 [Sphingobacteriales bacterium]